LTVVDEKKEEGMETVSNAIKPAKGSRSARINARKSAYEKVSPGDVEKLFEFWRTTLGKKALLSDERRAILAWAIANYGMETCEMAVKGCSMSDWHMGRNPSNVRYDSVELIFRNSEKVEWFVERFQSSSPGQAAGGDPF